MSAGPRLLPLYALCLLPFLLLATMNSAGYRYGASDQAFYAPAMLKAIDPSLYPRDSALIRSQARLTLADDVIGPVARMTGLRLPPLFAALQVVALGLLAAAACLIGRTLYRTTWTIVALLALLTLRHAISKSGTNTLEGYFHPRQLSFALGALAIAAYLRGRAAAAAALVAAAFALHPTTALWLGLWLALAALVEQWRSPRVRITASIAAVACAAAAAWALLGGPLAGRLARMDPEWLATLAAKDYLFPLAWPAVTWLVNLGYVPLILWIYQRRRAAGLLVPGEKGLVFGCLALAAVFATLLPLNAARIALAVQLQPARVFWMLDFLAAIYVVWAVAEDRSGSARRARVAAIAFVALAAARGSFVMFVEFPERRIAQIDVPDSDWGRAMAFARASAAGSGWLAHPEHAARYGVSVRVAGHRDVFVEAIKDGAVGMYDRAVALRTRDRVEALGDFDALTPDRARALGQEYALDYLITEQPMALPEAFASGRLHVYRLR
jgi:hypothetical protein